jgi:hypothetical protein
MITSSVESADRNRLLFIHGEWQMDLYDGLPRLGAGERAAYPCSNSAIEIAICISMLGKVETSNASPLRAELAPSLCEARLSVAACLTAAAGRAIAVPCGIRNGSAGLLDASAFFLGGSWTTAARKKALKVV